MAIVLVVVIFFFFLIWEKKSVPLTSEALDVLKILAVHWLKMLRIAILEHTVLKL